MAGGQLGELEHQVMLALMRQEEEGYSLSVVTELEEAAGREVAAAAVYIVLRRLEEKGLLTSEIRRAPAKDGGRERRYFALTAAGRERLRESRETYLRLWEGLETALDHP